MKKVFCTGLLAFALALGMMTVTPKSAKAADYPTCNNADSLTFEGYDGDGSDRYDLEYDNTAQLQCADPDPIGGVGD